MKLDYLNILQTKGFKMPKNFTNYDYNNMVEIQDTRPPIRNKRACIFSMCINRHHIHIGQECLLFHL